MLGLARRQLFGMRAARGCDWAGQHIAQAVRAGSTHFSIPFDRQQLADYLNLDRSALSKELGKMRDDGLIRCRKNEFELCGTE